MELKYRLRDLRVEYKISQEKLADILGITRGAVAQWENGFTIPSSETLNRLADYFNVSLDYLMGRTDVKQPYKTTTIQEDDFLLAFSNLSGELTDEDKKSILKMAQAFAASNEAKKEKK